MSKLGINDVDFLVTRTINQCPNTMMLRELIQNCIEATEKTKFKQIKLKSTKINGVNKLTFWNTGIGMNAEELRTMCDLSSSIRKTNTLDTNYGLGGKVSSLGANQLGLRFRSCRDGKVFEVAMGKEKNQNGEDIYVRYDYPAGAETGTLWKDVADVTNAPDIGYPIDHDWTEVVCFGNEEKQNTVTDPFNSNPKVSSQWIAKSLYQRFFRIDDDIDFTIDDKLNKKGGTRKFRTFPEIIKEAKENHPELAFYETVFLPEENIHIHYVYDGKSKNGKNNITYNYSLTSDVSFGGVVYKNEIYDLRQSSKWYMTAPVLGVPFGQKQISIFYELHDNANVISDQYRQNILFNDLEKKAIALENDRVATLIRDNLPTWLKEKIQSHSPETKNSNEVKKDLEEYIKNLNAFNNSPNINKDGTERSSINTNGLDSFKTPSSDKKTIGKPRRIPLTDIGEINSSLKSNPLLVPEFFVFEN